MSRVTTKVMRMIVTEERYWTVGEIVDIVCHRTGYHPDAIRAQNRSKFLMGPRREICWLARALTGKSLVVIGKALGKDPADAAWDIVLGALPNRAYGLFFMMDEGDIDLALQRPWVSIGTDAGAAATFGEVDAIGLPHPRAYGTFPRILGRYVRERKILTLEDAVRKMTSWPAQRMGLTDRGVLREGLRADIAIFDADTVAEGASWEKPLAAPTGIDDVIVNGVPVLRAGKMTGARPGQALRHMCRR